MSLERGPHEVYGIKDIQRDAAIAELTRFKIQRGKVKRPFLDHRKFARQNVCCFKKYICFRKYIFYNFLFYLLFEFDCLFDFISNLKVNFRLKINWKINRKYIDEISREMKPFSNAIWPDSFVVELVLADERNGGMTIRSIKNPKRNKRKKKIRLVALKHFVKSLKNSHKSKPRSAERITNARRVKLAARWRLSLGEREKKLRPFYRALSYFMLMRDRKLQLQVFAGGISRALPPSQPESRLLKGRSVHCRDPLCKIGGQRCTPKSRWRGIKSY